MPAFTIKKLTVDEAKAEFKRTGNNLEKLDDYIDTLRGLSIGEAITVKVQGGYVEVEEKAKNAEGKLVPTGKMVEKWEDIIPETTDEDGDADTARAFKRRMQAAAGSLGFKLKWKNKGHREGEGENARFVMDWLSGLAVESSVDVSEDGENETTTGK